MNTRLLSDATAPAPFTGKDPLMMSRPRLLLTATLVAAISLLGPTQASAQTKTPYKILFENLSRETVNIREVSLLQDDGTNKANTNNWSFQPGARSYLAEGTTGLKGRRILYTLETMDGAKLKRQSANESEWIIDGEFILQPFTDADLAEARKADKDRKLTKGEATYRYWNAVHGVHLEENLDAIQNVGFLEITKA